MDERLQRSEDAIRDYLDGDPERVFTERFSRLFAQRAQQRLRLAIEARREEAQ